jgi:hypothetical protein
LVKINCQAIDFALPFVLVKLQKLSTIPPTHVIDVDINILNKDTMSCIVFATIQKEVDLVEDVRVAIIKTTTA